MKGVYPIESVDELLGYLKDGVNTGESGFTTSYFTDYKEAKDLKNGFGLNEIVFAGAENILGSKENEIIMLEERWLKINYKLYGRIL